MSVYCVVPKWYQVVSTRCVELMSLILLQRLECLLLLMNGVIGKKRDAGLVEGALRKIPHTTAAVATFVVCLALTAVLLGSSDKRFCDNFK